MQQFRYFSLLAAAILVCFSTVNAQTVEPEEEEIRMMVRHSLIHWIDPLLPSAQVGIDYRVAPKLYLRHELGYFLDLGFEEPESLAALNGFRLRTAFRQYRREALPSRRSTYLEINLLHRRTCF